MSVRLLPLLLLGCATPVVLSDSQAPLSAGEDGGGEGTGSEDGGGDGTGGEDGGTTGGEDGGTVPAAADCGLADDLVTPWFTEGDTVTFNLQCTGGLATEDAEIKPLGLPDGATFDEESRVFTWETDGTDGGRYDLAFSARALDSGEIPGTATVTFWVADDPGAPNAEPPEPAAYTEEWGLPVIHVSMAKQMSETYQAATVTWRGKEYLATAKIRGASSAGYSKPGYILEFGEDEIAIPGWGPDDRDHLILLTTFDDNSYVRQKLIFDQWFAIADYWGEARLTPRSFYTVLYLNGSYNGLFVGLDHVDNEFVRQMGFNPDGNMYKAVNHDANFFLTASGGGPKGTLHQGYEKKEGLPEDDFADLDSLVSFTGGSTVATLVADAEEHFRTDEFMDWFLLVNYSLAEDSAGKNSYLYFEPDMGMVLYAPWDFNHSWGQSWYTTRISSSSIDEYKSTNRIFKAFQEDSGASEALWDRFRQMRADGPFSNEWLQAQVDGYYADIEPSAERDWAKWSASYRAYWWAPYRNAAGDWTDYQGEKSYVTEWLDERAALYESLIPD